MNLKGLLAVFVAAALVLSVGMTSNSLDAVETDPSDQFDTSWIPTQDNNPQQKQKEKSGGSGTSSSSSSSTSSSSSGGGGGGSSSGEDLRSGGDIDAKLEEVKGTAEDTMDLGSGDSNTQAKSGGGGGDAGGKQKTVPLWKRLLNLLLEYIWHILAGLAVVAALVGGYVYYKRRFAGEGRNDLEIVYDVDTSNDVYRSWWEMVEMLDAEEPTTKTPQEFAEIAVEEGLEPEAVSELTRLFEEALYGGKEITKEKEERAREAVERLKAKGRKAV